MKTIALQIITALSILTACTDLSDENIFQYDKEAVFKIGPEYVSEDGAITLTIDSIQDSRCPINVECIWQGEITMDLTVEIGEKYSSELRSVNHSKDTIQGYELEVIDATPYPEIGVEILPDEYHVTLRVSRL